MKADLHCHSTFSDGLFTPKEVVHLAKKHGFEAAVITDHDTFSGFHELQDEAKKEGLRYITGIEISTIFDDASVHIVGYGFNPHSEAMHSYEQQSHEARRLRAKKIIMKLQSCGVSITEEEVFQANQGSYSIGRPHVARLLVQKQYGRTVRDIFATYLGDTSPAYVPNERISVQEGIQLIHEAGGFAMIAHPHLYRNKKRVIQLLDRFAFDGLEVAYCRFPESENLFWHRLAEERALMKTGGSDFHGEGRDDVLYGASLAPEETVQFLWDHMIAWNKEAL